MSYSARLAVSVIALALGAGADEIIGISFDGLEQGEDVLDYYNGGLGSLGSGPGPRLRVSFGPGWIAGPPDVYGQDGNSAGFSGTALVNFHSGWSGMTSFYYLGSELFLSLFSGEDGEGELIALLALPAEPGFTSVALDVPTFRSAVFSSPGAVNIDALTSGAFVIPEPAVFQLSLAGLLFLAWRGRRASFSRRQETQFAGDDGK